MRVMSNRTLFHSLTFADAATGMAFLEAVGFDKAAVYTDPDDPEVVVHAQYNWRDTGGVMFGSRRDKGPQWLDSTGQARCYCVVDSDARVDEVHAAALRAGGSSVQEPMDMDYGGRGCTVRYPEGNEWSFGSYPGE
jgi:uncharacterized glyoxalase superfamily protein PhnB